MRKAITRRRILWGCLSGIGTLLANAATSHTAEKGGPGPGDKGVKPASGTSSPPAQSKGGETKGKDPNQASGTKDRN